MNSFWLGAKMALDDYPFVSFDKPNDYEQCLNLLLDVYEQYKADKITQKQILWTIGELHRIMRC